LIVYFISYFEKLKVNFALFTYLLKRMRGEVPRFIEKISFYRIKKETLL